MIEPNTTWYLGTIGSWDNYKASICANVGTSISANTCIRTTMQATANIGLPRVGEMFTSQITRGTKNRFLTLTPYSTSQINTMDSEGFLAHHNPSYAPSVHLSMYLKSTVKIASSNTGDGTYERPYTIE